MQPGSQNLCDHLQWEPGWAITLETQVSWLAFLSEYVLAERIFASKYLAGRIYIPKEMLIIWFPRCHLCYSDHVLL